MSLQELTMLLARIQVLDNRQVDQLTIEAWAPLMEGVEYADAVAAVNAHFRESTEYLKPAHIISNVKRVREIRAREQRRRLRPPTPNLITFDRDQYQRDVDVAIAKARAEKSDG